MSKPLLFGASWPELSFILYTVPEMSCWQELKFQIVEQEQLEQVCDKVLRSNRAEALLRDIAKAKIICNEEVALMQMSLSE